VLKEDYAYYVDAKQELHVKEDHLQQTLHLCGLRKDCDMPCVRECSFWTHAPWTHCFNACGCTDKVGSEMEDHFHHHHHSFQHHHHFGFGFGLNGPILHSYGSVNEPDYGFYWSWIGLDSHYHARIEHYLHDGSRTSVTCPTQQECHISALDEKEQKHFLEIRRQIRAAASAILDIIDKKNIGVTFHVEKEFRKSGETHITFFNGEVRHTLQVIDDEKFPHTYIVRHVSEESTQTFWVILQGNLDGSYTAAVANHDYFIFTNAFSVALRASKTSIGGYSFVAKPVTLPKEVYAFFQRVREQNLIQADKWTKWVRMVEENHFYDVHSNTDVTVRSYIRLYPNYDDIEEYANHVIITNRTFHLPSPIAFNFTRNNTIEEHFKEYHEETRVINHTGKVHKAGYDIVYFRDQQFRLYKNGSAYTRDGDFVCNGGIDALRTYIEESIENKLDEDYEIIHYGNMSFYLYSNKTMTLNGKVLTNDGSVEFLREYFRPKYEIYIINGEEYHVYNGSANGTVKDIHGKVIVNHGGIEALKYLLKPQYMRYFVNNHEYLVYLNGTVTDPSHKLIIKEGGINSLLKYLTVVRKSTIVYTTVIINGKDFRVFDNGTVTDGTGKVILKTGGLDRLKDEFKPDYKYVYVNGTHLNSTYRFTLYNNGSAYTQDGKLVAHNATIETLKNYYRDHEEEYMPITEIQFQGHVFYEYANGSVISDSGVMIVSKGGLKLFEHYLWSNHMANYTTITCTGEHFFLLQNGTGVDENGTIVSEGGLHNLKQYVMNHHEHYDFPIYVLDGEKYRIFENGTVVYQRNGSVVIENGDADDLVDWAKNRSHIIFHFRGIEFFMDPNGTVYNGKTGKLISTEGREGFEEYVEKQSFTTVYVEGHDLEFRVYANGKVTFANGTALAQFTSKNASESLGELEEYINTLFASNITLYSYQNETYKVLQNGTVYDFGSGEVVAPAGGLPALKEFLAEKYHLNVTLIVINEEHRFIVYRNGTVVWAKDGKFLLNGGEAALYEWATKKFGGPNTIFVVNGKYSYTLLKNGSITNEKGDIVIEKNGSADSLLEYLQGRITPFRIDYHFTNNDTGFDEKYVWFTSNGTAYDSEGNVVVTNATLDEFREHVRSSLNEDKVYYEGYGLIFYWDVKNESMHFTNGTLIPNVTDKDELLRFVWKHYSIEQIVYIVPQEEPFYVNTQSGRVRFANGTVLFEEGGLHKLKEWGNENLLIIRANMNGHFFTIYKNGTVISEKSGKVVEGVHTYEELKQHMRDHYPKKIIVVGHTFYLWPNGTAFDLEGNQVSTGGRKGLHDYASDKLEHDIITFT